MQLGGTPIIELHNFRFPRSCCPHPSSNRPLPFLPRESSLPGKFSIARRGFQFGLKARRGGSWSWKRVIRDVNVLPGRFIITFGNPACVPWGPGSLLFALCTHIGREDSTLLVNRCIIPDTRCLFLPCFLLWIQEIECVKKC